MKTIILASKSPRRLDILRAHGIEPIVFPSSAEELLPDGISMTGAVEHLAKLKAMAAFNELHRLLAEGQLPDESHRISAEGQLPDEPHRISVEDQFPDALASIDLSNSIIIGSDTIVYKDEIMGKPADAEDAYRMLDSIRNSSHFVATGVALVNAESGECITLHDVTEVVCKDYSDQEIWSYIDSGEPFDKAGAYAIQGGWGKHIDHIVGDYENVVGLPFHIIAPLI